MLLWILSSLEAIKGPEPFKIISLSLIHSILSRQSGMYISSPIACFFGRSFSGSRNWAFTEYRLYKYYSFSLCLGDMTQQFKIWNAISNPVCEMVCLQESKNAQKSSLKSVAYVAVNLLSHWRLWWGLHTKDFG